MSKPVIYKFHRWLAITVGGFFLVWLLSGMVMILPTSSAGPGRQRTAVTLDWSERMVTPAEAVGSLKNVMGELPQVNAITLRRIADVPVYQIAIAGDGPHLISARSGEVFTITPRLAEEIIRSQFDLQSQVMQTELVTGHSLAYAWGPLPAYRIVLDGAGSTPYYVSTHDGAVHRSDRWSRIKAAVSSLHTFEPVKLIARGERLRKVLLFVLSAVGVATALSGYYLVLPRRKRRMALQVTPATEERVQTGVEHTR